jgi:phage shock protein PspC (stress-responsive transcriptional regulator)
MKTPTLRYAFVIFGVVAAAGGFLILYTGAQFPAGTDQYQIGNHAYETEIYSTSPMIQFLGLTFFFIGIASIVYALAILKTKPKPQPKEQTSAQKEAYATPQDPS